MRAGTIAPAQLRTGLAAPEEGRGSGDVDVTTDYNEQTLIWRVAIRWPSHHEPRRLDLHSTNPRPGGICLKTTLSRVHLADAEEMEMLWGFRSSRSRFLWALMI